MTETTCTWLEGWRKSNTHTDELEKAREALDHYLEAVEAEALKAAEQKERWQEIEERLDSIALDVQNRCYPEGSVTGVMHVLDLVIRNLSHARGLLEIEITEVIEGLQTITIENDA